MNSPAHLVKKLEATFGPFPGRCLVITGSRHGYPRLAEKLDAWVQRFGRPHMVVVGDADGVDTDALKWAYKMNYSITKCYVDSSLPSPERYMKRNQRMVDCGKDTQDIRGEKTHVVGFPDVRPPGEPNGTLRTMEMGRRAGLITVDGTRDEWLDELELMEASMQDGEF